MSTAAKLVEALRKGGFMMTEPKPTRSHTRARAVVIGFQDPEHADDAMAAISAFMRGQPHEPGSYVGDVFYGDPIDTTRGTHSWDGSAWSEIPQ